MPSNKKLLQAAAGSASGDNLYVEDVFSTYLYNGTGSSLAINNGLDLSGEGGLMWFKGRDGTYSHKWYDTERGIQYAIESDRTDGNQTEAQGVTAVGSSGFTLGTDGNTNSGGSTFISWSFRKAEGFFDIVTFDGSNGSGYHNFNHNLGSTPKCIIVKRTDGSENWFVYHASLASNGSQHLQLNTSSAADTGGGIFGTPTSTTFNVQPYAMNMTSGSNTAVAYLFGDDAVFGEDADEQISKMGSFTTDSNGDAEITLGFEPQWVLVKATTRTGNWEIADNIRGLPATASTYALSQDTALLYANTYGAESSSQGRCTIQANKFNVMQSANHSYIYIAIRRPMKVPEAGTEVYFQTTANAGTTLNTGFVPDFWIGGATAGNGGTASQFVMDRLRGPEYLATSSTNAEVGTNDPFNGFPTNTFMNNSQGGNRVEWIFRRASQFMDVVCLTGNGGGTRSITHNLTAAPEIIIYKRRDGSSPYGDWYIQSSYIGAGRYLTLNGTGAQVDSADAWSSTNPTSTVFTIGPDNNVNTYQYVAYLFATLAGISKVGSVVHSGTTDVDCGFSAGARFVLVKRTDSTGDWYVWDSVRGIVSGDDPYLLLNSSAAQVTNTDYIDPLASGFTLTSSFTAGTYIFLAIA